MVAPGDRKPSERHEEASQTPRPTAQLSGPGVRLSSERVGLCAACRHARAIVSAKGSEFWLCERSKADPSRFVKYPRLPVLRCGGFERVAGRAGS